MLDKGCLLCYYWVEGVLLENGDSIANEDSSFVLCVRLLSRESRY